MKELFSEHHRAEPGVVPSDFAAGVESARLSLKQANSATIVVSMGVGVGTTLDVTLRQHDAAAAGNSKDLVSNVPYYYKAAADTEFTRVDGSTANLLPTALDTAAGILVIEINSDDLDVNADFSHISLVVAAPGAARIMSVEYMVGTKKRPAYEQVL